MATTRTGGAATGGFRYPKAPSRIAREGFLTKGASPPTQFVPPSGTRQTKGVSSRGHQDPGRGRKVHGNGVTQGIPEHSRSGPTTRAACLPHARGCSCRRPEGAPRLRVRPEKNRGKTPAATRWARNRQSSLRGGFWPSATAPARPATIAQLAPPSQSPTPSGQQRPLRGGNDKAPAPHSGGNGCASLHRFCHPPTSGISANGGDPKGGPLGTGNGTTTRLQAPETTWSAPGAPRRARRHALSTPRRRAAWHRVRPPHHGEEVTHHQQPGEASESVRCVSRPQSRSDGRPGSGRSPHPSAPPRTAHRREGGAWGPQAEREERSHPPGVSVPRLTRLRPGPGEREITTSIGYRHTRQSWGEGGLGKRPARTATRGGPASASPAPLPHLSQGTGSRTTHKRKGERLTRGTEPCEGGFVTAAAGCPQRGAHRVEDPRRLPTPPSGARDRRWRHSLDHTWMHESRRAGPGRRLEQAGRQGRSRVRLSVTAKPGATPATTRPKSLLRHDHRHIRTCQHLPGSKKHLFQETKITALAGGAEPQVTGTFWDPGPATSPKHLPIAAEQPPPPRKSPGAIWSTPGPTDRPTDRPGNRGIGGGVLPA